MVPYQHVKGVIINYIATFLHKIHTISQLRVKSIRLGVFSCLSSPLILLAVFKTQFMRYQVNCFKHCHRRVQIRLRSVGTNRQRKA